jgi:hypothetical protein
LALLSISFRSAGAKNAHSFEQQHSTSPQKILLTQIFLYPPAIFPTFALLLQFIWKGPGL